MHRHTQFWRWDDIICVRLIGSLELTEAPKLPNAKGIVTAVGVFSEIYNVLKMSGPTHSKNDHNHCQSPIYKAIIKVELRFSSLSCTVYQATRLVKWDFELCISYQLEICMLYYMRPSFKVKHPPISSYRMLNILWIADGKHVPMCTSTSLTSLLERCSTPGCIESQEPHCFQFGVDLGLDMVHGLYVFCRSSLTYMSHICSFSPVTLCLYSAALHDFFTTIEKVSW